MTYSQKNLWVCVNGDRPEVASFGYSRKESIQLFFRLLNISHKKEMENESFERAEAQGWRCIKVNMELTEVEK